MLSVAEERLGGIGLFLKVHQQGSLGGGEDLLEQAVKERLEIGRKLPVTEVRVSLI